TAIRNPEEVLTHHLLDSATLVPALQRFVPGVDAVLDVGCGGGLPSVPLALLLPHVSVMGVDAVGKKAAFVNQAAIELGLKNLTARHARVERMVGTWKAITSRAFASLADFTHLTMHLLASDGRWLAMKGVVPEDEIAALPSNVKVLAIEKLVVPGLEEERHLIVLGKE
ncbi:16S rRNA (guanine(527)-N(7))-methyltransferase RsmG, partial [Sutterella wadsworthensis]